MNRSLRVGLVAEGNSTHSMILRLPKIAEELGPIKSAALRVARRLSNFLRAGYAVIDYEDLQPAKLILLRVPDTAAARVVQELSASALRFKDISLVLCESWLMEDVLEPLRLRGASVATLVGFSGVRRNWFAIEGDRAAVQQVRRFLERNDARALEIRPGAKPLYFAAQLLATALPVPLFTCAQAALRESGISGNHLQMLLGDMGQCMFRDLLKGGRSASAGPLEQCSTELAGHYLRTLEQSHPGLAEVINRQLAWSQTRMAASKHS